ncbi:MAG: hypothetical protein QXP36_02615 [Conexivisphaerales archaeon]
MKLTEGYVLPILLIIALAAIGLNYAYWNETLTINGTVNTGEVKVIWNYDPWEHPSVQVYDDYYTPSTVASASWTPIDDHTFSVTFNNLYPGVMLKFQGYARNMGTIPVKFDHIDITIINDPKGVANYLYVVPTDTYISWDQDGNGPIPPHPAHSPVWGGYTNFPFTLLDDAINSGPIPGWPYTYAVPKFVLNPPTTPGDWRTAGRMAFCDEEGNGCIRLKVDPNAPDSIEGATLTFTVSFTFIQWNAP